MAKIAPRDEAVLLHVSAMQLREDSKSRQTNLITNGGISTPEKTNYVLIDERHQKLPDATNVVDYKNVVNDDQ